MTSHRQRELDIVVVGATGFTGALTAEYLAGRGPGATRWAMAGRNRRKLEALRERLGVDVPILEADVDDQASLRRVAEASRVVVSTVGPYVRYGEPVVAACAEAGTDYADLTGEPEFVDRVYVRHHATAQRTGARLVHACGFDSVPHDLGTLFTVQQTARGAADPRARVCQRGRAALWRDSGLGGDVVLAVAAGGRGARRAPESGARRWPAAGARGGGPARL